MSTDPPYFFGYIAGRTRARKNFADLKKIGTAPRPRIFSILPEFFVKAGSHKNSTKEFPARNNSGYSSGNILNCYATPENFPKIPGLIIIRANFSGPGAGKIFRTSPPIAGMGPDRKESWHPALSYPYTHLLPSEIVYEPRQRVLRGCEV